MHEGVVVRDAQGTIVDVNPAAERILRRSRDQLIGSKQVNPRTAVHPDGSPFPHHESAASVALATGRDVVEQLNGLHMDDGELRWISVNARALREDGVITGVVTTFVDVTEQRNIADALAESEAAAVAARDALTTVLDATTQYAIIGTDADGLITVFNGGAERMLGYQRRRRRRASSPGALPRPRGARAPRRRVRHSRRIRARARHAPPRHRHARLDAGAQRRRQGARVAHDHGNPRGRRAAHRVPGHRPGHHGRAPGRARAARRRGALPQRLRPGADRQGAGLDRRSLHARQQRPLRHPRLQRAGAAGYLVPDADASRGPGRRPRADAARARGRERVVLDGEALPARRRPLHLGAPERLAGA